MGVVSSSREKEKRVHPNDAKGSLIEEENGRIVCFDQGGTNQEKGEPLCIVRGGTLKQQLIVPGDRRLERGLHNLSQTSIGLSNLWKVGFGDRNKPDSVGAESLYLLPPGVTSSV